MEVLKYLLNFVFRDFWTFSGTVILLYIIGLYWITAPLYAIACIFNKNLEWKHKENIDEKLDFSKAGKTETNG